jgi:hypothetical protein
MVLADSELNLCGGVVDWVSGDFDPVAIGWIVFIVRIAFFQHMFPFAFGRVDVWYVVSSGCVGVNVRIRNLDELLM